MKPKRMSGAAPPIAIVTLVGTGRDIRRSIHCAQARSAYRAAALAGVPIVPIRLTDGQCRHRPGEAMGAHGFWRD